MDRGGRLCQCVSLCGRPLRNAISIRTELDPQLPATTADGQLLISVSDTGIGISDDQAARIFDAFFTTKPLGTGMGLSISRRIIASHDGRLWASANEGRGATFQFTLPVGATAS